MADNELWDEWFDGQMELTQRIERAVEGLATGKDDNFRAALYSAVIEHAAERLRMYIIPLRA
jgi:hypothetical protein